MADKIPTGSTHVAIGLAALTAAGGIAAFVRRRSARSLAASLVFSGCFAASAYFVENGQVSRGYRFALINSALMAGIMGYRFVKTQKPFPAGVLAVVATGSAAYYGKKYMDWEA